MIFFQLSFSQGDSGGSAIALNGGRPLLVGVANFIVRSCGSSYPDAYAKVSFYKAWIENTILRVEAARLEILADTLDHNFIVID